MEPINNRISGIFTKPVINLDDLIPNQILTPETLEGNINLTITESIGSEEFSGFHKGKKRIVINFVTEEGQTLRKTFYIGVNSVNLLKFLNDVLGTVPEGEFNLNDLKGKKVRAFIYHNYLDNGKGYANIVACRPIDNDENA